MAAVIARYRQGELVFEILVDCEKAMQLKQGKQLDIAEILQAYGIFSDAKKGLRAREEDLRKVFNTTNVEEIAKKIILEGEIQLTAEYRAKLREEKKKRIISLINKNAIDPRTGLPIPPERIELAMKEAKINIDEFKTAEQQLDSIISKLRPILPIKIEKVKLKLKIPPSYCGKVYILLKKFGELLNEEWLNDGSYSVIAEIPAGIKQDFFDQINNLTKGEAEIDIIK